MFGRIDTKFGNKFKIKFHKKFIALTTIVEAN